MITSDDDHQDRTPSDDFGDDETTRVDILRYREPPPPPPVSARRGLVFAGCSVRQVTQVAGEIAVPPPHDDASAARAAVPSVLRTWR